MWDPAAPDVVPRPVLRALPLICCLLVAASAAHAAAPQPPRQLRAVARAGAVALRWTPPAARSGIVRVRIYRRGAARRWTRRPIAVVPAAAGRYLDTGLTVGRRYAYRLRTVSAAGRYSPLSVVVSATARRRIATRRPAATPVVPTPAPPGPAPAPPAAGSAGEVPPADPGCPAYGPYDALHQPGACWRPYGAASPFNRPIGADPPLRSDSAAIVARLTGWGAPQQLLAGHAGTADDYFHPVYYARNEDPQFTVHCTVATRGCAVEGLKVRIPDAAKAAGGEDGHLAVVDQASGWEYDFWQVRSKPAGGGTLTVSHGGRTRIDGDGLGSNATAAWFGLAAGIIRPAELAAGVIPHALFAPVKCTAGVSVYPAHPGTTANACDDFGLSNVAAPPLGARFQLAMTDAEIAALGVPAWKQAILRALAHYGMIVGDTNGGHAAWGLQGESGSSWASFGLADPWDALAAGAGLRAWNGMYAFDIGSGVDWTRLRVVDPCVSQGTC